MRVKAKGVPASPGTTAVLLPPRIGVTNARSREAPSITSARLVLALLRGECAPTSDGVADYLAVYRSTAFRLLSRLVKAGILTRRMERRDRIPPLWVYAVAETSKPPGEEHEQG